MFQKPIKVSYCSRKNLSPYFFDELSGDTSQAFASNMEVFKFEDYNIDILKQDESSKLNYFAANCCLTIYQTSQNHHV